MHVLVGRSSKHPMYKAFPSLSISFVPALHLHCPPWQLVIEVALADKRGQPVVPVKIAFGEDCRSLHFCGPFYLHPSGRGAILEEDKMQNFLFASGFSLQAAQCRRKDTDKWSTQVFCIICLSAWGRNTPCLPRCRPPQLKKCLKRLVKTWWQVKTVFSHLIFLRLVWFVFSFSSLFHFLKRPRCGPFIIWS